MEVERELRNWLSEVLSKINDAPVTNDIKKAISNQVLKVAEQVWNGHSKEELQERVRKEVCSVCSNVPACWAICGGLLEVVKYQGSHHHHHH
uniref:De novo designed protein 4H_01 n=1 Tax=synthetic construct TaxID=32630 RepID=UPI00174F7D1F|nr:Chain C, De novo designed protein 4H_01 [synthetic construct]